MATWNQPIEVVRVEMQSMSKNISKNRPEKLTVFNTLGFIYKENGMKGLYRGVTPRIGLGIWQTVCMVSFADYVKAWYGALPYFSRHDTYSLVGSRSQLRSKGQIKHRTAWRLVLARGTYSSICIFSLLRLQRSRAFFVIFFWFGPRSGRAPANLRPLDYPITCFHNEFRRENDCFRGCSTAQKDQPFAGCISRAVVG